jgi:hypothetical protein
MYSIVSLCGGDIYLIQLANTIDWAIFDNTFAKYYSKDNGTPSGVKEVLAAKIILPH